MVEPVAKIEVFVPSCGFRVSQKPVVLHTVLGSCVSVCLWDRRSAIGGMNHYLLAHSNVEGPVLDMQVVGKYADLAVPHLLRSLERLGASPESIVAKIVGGARILRLTPYAELAQRNIEAGKRLLRKLGIAVVSEDVGGVRGRKVRFHTETGRLVVNEDKII